MEYQEDIAIVKKYKNGIALVEIQKSEACNSCLMSKVCMGKDKSFLHKITTDMQLEIGDLVKIYISPGVKIFSSFIIFIFPVLSMIFFYFSGKYIFKLTENFSILVSFAGLFLSGVIIYIIDKKYSKKIHFEIIEKVEK